MWFLCKGVRILQIFSLVLEVELSCSYQGLLVVDPCGQCVQVSLENILRAKWFLNPKSLLHKSAACVNACSW